jgi:hypothetical protein
MRINSVDNRDPRWTDMENAAIEAKVDEAMNLSPRLEIMSGESYLSQKERRAVLVGSFREIAKATSIDNVVAAPPALLEQFSVIALQRNHNVKGELVQMIRIFMMAYADPSTNQHASDCLAALEKMVMDSIAKRPIGTVDCWKPLPGSVPSRTH